jgi:hypothetical protein
MYKFITKKPFVFLLSPGPFNEVRFQVLKAVSVKMTVFWDIAPYSVVELER